MSVAAILRDKGNTIVSVLPETPLMDIVTTIASRRIGAVLVCNAPGELVGIVSERDVVKALAAKGSGLDGLAARDVMTPEVTTVTPQTSIKGRSSASSACAMWCAPASTSMSKRPKR